MNLSTPAHVPLQSPYPHLVLHAGEEVQHAAVREVPRVLTARLVEELLLQVHVIAPVSALQEDWSKQGLRQRARKATTISSRVILQPMAWQGGKGSPRMGVSRAWVLYSVSKVFQSLPLLIPPILPQIYPSPI